MKNNDLQRHVLGTWIRRRRTLLRWTQAALAKKVGCTTDLISKIEHDRRGVSAQIAPRLIQVFELTGEEQESFLRLVRDARASKPDSELYPSHIASAARRVNDHLPEPTTLLIGRETEVTHGVALLNKPNLRLLTLIGPPGVGKTRLGIEIARQMRTQFADGTFYVSLAAVPRGGGLLQTLFDALATHLALGQTDPADLLTALAGALANRHLLLVLDNFEHLLSDANAQVVSQLLVTSSKLKIIITSRTTLSISAEHQLRVEPLAIPSPLPAPLIALDQTEHLDALAHCPAVALFVDRAQASNDRFNLTPANAESVRDLCIFSEGLPLVIELLATRSRLLQPAELLAQIRATPMPEAFILALTGQRDAPEHQRTMARAIDWSYGLLPPEAQQMFMQLGVFVGGFTLEAAAAVCEPSPNATLQTLEALLHASLIQSQHAAPTHLYEIGDVGAGDKTHETRFSLLESIRAFALGRLRASGHYAQVCRRHASHYLHKAKQEMDPYANADNLMLVHDLDNIRAALQWGHSTEGDLELALQLTTHLVDWWWRQGYFSERDYWTHRALRLIAPDLLPQAQLDAHDAPFGASPRGTRPADTGADVANQRAESDQPTLIRRAAAELVVSLFSAHREDIALIHVKALLTRQLAVARKLDDQQLLVPLYWDLLVYVSDDAPDDPDIPAIENAVYGLIEEVSEPRLQVWLWNAIGISARLRAEYDKARVVVSRALDLARRIGDVRAVANQTAVLGGIEYWSGNVQHGKIMLAEALRLHNEYCDMYGVIYGCMGFAIIAGDEKQWERCATLFYTAQTFISRGGIVLDQVDRRYADKVIALAQAALSSEAFEAARQTGSAMKITEMVALALSDSAFVE